MKKILVLGSGCDKCVRTAEFIDKVAKEHGLQVFVIKETSPHVMLKYGVIGTPAVVVDEQLMHAGSVPDRKTVENWLQ